MIAVGSLGLEPTLSVLTRDTVTGRSFVRALNMGTGEKRNRFVAGSRLKPIDIALINDSDGSGPLDDPAYAILAEKVADGKSIVRTRRVVDNKRLDDVVMLDSKWNAESIAIGSDISGNGAEELISLGKRVAKDRLIIMIKDQETGTKTGAVYP